jgi:hypothetical protein
VLNRIFEIPQPLCGSDGERGKLALFQRCAKNVTSGDRFTENKGSTNSLEMSQPFEYIVDVERVSYR